jgi:hypothetical protein
VTDATGILSRQADMAEREWHDAYRSLVLKENPATKKKPANRPWEELDEEYRVANRRAVAHIYAKLFDAGFDIRPWFEWANVWHDAPALAPGERLFRDEAERSRLAELEHERWCAERRMQGWKYGPERIEAAKIHDCLVPYAQLSAEVQGYDLTFTDYLDKTLRRVERGVRRYA